MPFESVFSLCMNVSSQMSLSAVILKLPLRITHLEFLCECSGLLNGTVTDHSFRDFMRKVKIADIYGACLESFPNTRLPYMKSHLHLLWSYFYIDCVIYRYVL